MVRFRCFPCSLRLTRAMSWTGSTALVLRVLYRLRTLSEQAPFDAATFSFAFFLLGRVAQKGGVGVDEGGEQDGDEAIEQVALMLDVIKFHRSECTSPSRDCLVWLTHWYTLSFGRLLSSQDDARTRVARGEDATTTEQGGVVAPHRSGRGDPRECDAGRSRCVDRWDTPPGDARPKLVSASAPGVFPCMPSPLFFF